MLSSGNVTCQATRNHWLQTRHVGTLNKRSCCEEFKYGNLIVIWVSFAEMLDLGVERLSSQAMAKPAGTCLAFCSIYLPITGELHEAGQQILLNRINHFPVTCQVGELCCILPGFPLSGLTGEWGRVPQDTQCLRSAGTQAVCQVSPSQVSLGSGEGCHKILSAWGVLAPRLCVCKHWQ